MTLRLDWCGHDAARYAVEHWHYSQSLPVPPLVKVGVWEHQRFIGCVIFSRGATPNLLKPYGLSQTEGCELTRVALAAHEAPVSRILALALRFLRRSNPGLRLIISFADANEGHHGGIYQATNWIYAGKTAPSIEYEDKQGRRWHGRQVSKTGSKTQFGVARSTPKISDCRKILCDGKHRYLMPLDDPMRAFCAKLAQPYPKRAGSKANVAPANHAGEGGVTPTPALHLSSEVAHGAS